VASWLPQPDGWAALSVAAQTGTAASTLELYRTALLLRRDEPAFSSSTCEWLPAAADVLILRRGEGAAAVDCVVNLSQRAIPLAGSDVLTCSDKLIGGDELPPDAAAWVRAR
jgi:alpha-glucosidase